MSRRKKPQLIILFSFVTFHIAMPSSHTGFVCTALCLAGRTFAGLPLTSQGVVTVAIALYDTLGLVPGV